MKKPSLQTMATIIGFFMLGLVAAVAAWGWHQQGRSKLIPSAVEQCTNVVTLAVPPSWDNAAYSRRALLISDCMASNNYLFLGAGPESRCYSINPIQQELKHILPSCYKPVLGLMSY